MAKSQKRSNREAKKPKQDKKDKSKPVATGSPQVGRVFDRGIAGSKRR